MNGTAGSLTAYCRERDRVCPMPQPWKSLHDIPSNCSRVGAGWPPLLPLLFAVGGESPPGKKRDRLGAHSRWAAAYNSLKWTSFEMLAAVVSGVDSSQAAANRPALAGRIAPKIPEGASETVVRTVTDNARTLRSSSQGLEQL